MEKQLLLWTLDLICCMTLINSESLTFLGGENRTKSMAVFAGWNAKEKATINFQFKTSKENGLLFYQHGRESHLKLSLDSGKLALSIYYSAETNIEKSLGRELNDLKWHNVTVMRNHRATMFELDGMQKLMTKLYWKKVLDVTSDLYVGNVGNTERADVSNPGFIGCIKDLKYGEGYNELAIRAPIKGIKSGYSCYNYCNNILKHKPRCLHKGHCVNKFTTYSCDCFGTGYEGTHCERASKVISLHSNMDFISMSVSSLRTKRSNTIQLRFKTVEKNGILFTMGKENDFMVLEVFLGQVRLEANLGGGKIVMQNTKELNDGSWHDVKIDQTGSSIKMIVDDRKSTRFEETKKSPYGSVDFGCGGGDDIAYIGGHFNPITVIGSKSKQGFVGCLQQVYINTGNVVKEILKVVHQSKGRKLAYHPLIEIDGKIDTKCNITYRPIVRKPPPKKTTTKVIPPTRKKKPKTGNKMAEASSIQQTPRPGKREAKKLEKSSVAWITAGLVIGSLVIILVMAFLIHRFRKKYRGSFMAPRDDNGIPYYSSVQSGYHMQNGFGKRQGRGSATDV